MALLSEEEILKKASSGDIKAFEEIVSLYEKPLYNLAFRFLSQPDDAMDVVQEVFLKVFQSISTFRMESKFSTWVYRVCVNTCLDFLRKKPRFSSVSLDEPLTWDDSSFLRQIEDPKENVTLTVERKELAGKLMDLLLEIDPNYRSVIILCDVQGFSYQETASILGISMGTVKSRLHRARSLLRTIFTAEQNSPSFVEEDERRDR